MRVFLHREGMARFCTQRYARPSEENLDDLFMHLTNYSINKSAHNFVENQEVKVR